MSLDKRTIIDRYEEQARTYDSSRFGSVGGRCMSLLEASMVSEYLIEGSVLELGVGTGRFAFEMVKKGVGFVGVDITRNMLRTAKENMMAKGVKFEVVNMDAESLGFSEAFDNVVCLHTFHFLPHPLEALSDAFGALRRGGRCIVSFERRGLWNTGFSRFDVIKKNLYSIDEVARMFRAVGFEVIGRRAIFNAPYRFYRKAPAFLVRKMIEADAKREGWLIGLVAGKK